MVKDKICKIFELDSNEITDEKLYSLIVTGSFSFLIYLYIKQNEQILI